MGDQTLQPPPETSYAAGFIHFNGEDGNGSGRDVKQAMTCWEAAAELGHAEAQVALGKLFLGGNGVPADPGRAVGWLEQAADSGVAEAQYELGLCYQRGHGVTASWRDAVGLWRQAAGGGHQPAADRVEAVSRGDAASFPGGAEEARGAAEKGDAEAMMYMAEHCLGGGVGGGEEGRRWLRSAADQGHAGAMFRLGVLLEGGEGLQMLNDAAGAGHLGAQSALWEKKENVSPNGSPGPALETLETAAAARQGDARAMHELGCRYHEGRGVPADSARAAHWWARAAEQGHACAQLLAGACYEMGRGVARDPALALKFYEMAMAQVEKIRIETKAIVEGLRSSGVEPCTPQGGGYASSPPPLAGQQRGAPGWGVKRARVGGAAPRPLQMGGDAHPPATPAPAGGGAAGVQGRAAAGGTVGSA